MFSLDLTALFQRLCQKFSRILLLTRLIGNWTSCRKIQG